VSWDHAEPATAANKTPARNSKCQRKTVFTFPPA
jgi:hypothetical protein